MKKLEYCYNYLNSKKKSVKECYKNPSFEKRMAEMEILNEMKKKGGSNYRIITHNAHIFTCGYIKYDEIVNQFLLVVHTPKKAVIIYPWIDCDIDFDIYF